ncbi:hypothetical protein OROMI_007249 [Orobanche minor]
MNAVEVIKNSGIRLGSKHIRNAHFRRLSRKRGERKAYW